MSILTCCTCNQSFSQESAGMHRCGAHPPEVTTTPVAERIERVLAFWQRAGGSSRLTLADLLIAEMYEAINEAKSESFSQGAEWMREKAAQVCYEERMHWSGAASAACERLAVNVRALPTSREAAEKA